MSSWQGIVFHSHGSKIWLSSSWIRLKLSHYQFGLVLTWTRLILSLSLSLGWMAESYFKYLCGHFKTPFHFLTFDLKTSSTSQPLYLKVKSHSHLSKTSFTFQLLYVKPLLSLTQLPFLNPNSFHPFHFPTNSTCFPASQTLYWKPALVLNLFLFSGIPFFNFF